MLDAFRIQGRNLIESLTESYRLPMDIHILLILKYGPYYIGSIRYLRLIQHILTTSLRLVSDQNNPSRSTRVILFALLYP